MFAVHVAVYVLSPVDPATIVTVLLVPVIPVPVQPANVYPVFVGFFNVIAALSIVYSLGFPVTLPPSKLYSISYVIAFHFAFLRR